ncbi:hypothetical protein CLF_111780 [Clonorchis sinensis]|uniref:WRKY domain-containing protein n=1 Tax=Clonorchis sinensis TaxID=79923 RepID=G7YLZ2_CLOSI|nr:hypothetical protein CLF_111780 [Clonorchis sinensis]
MTNNFVVFVRLNSQKSSDSKLLYEKAFYRCSRRPCRQSQGRGIRRSYTRCSGCQARVHVRRYNDHLMVTSYYPEHNHPRSKFIFDRLPVNRRLTNEELKECSTLLKYGAPSSEIRQYVADHFGKVLTIQDVYNYRVKCRPPLLNDMQSIITQLQECGRVLLVESEGGRLNHLCFSRKQQIAPFRRFPDVVNVDATHGTNRLGEHFVPLRKLFCLFKEMMGGKYPVRTFVMDKMTSQMRTAKAVFGCDIMLCYFHARQAIRKHVRFMPIVWRRSSGVPPVRDDKQPVGCGMRETRGSTRCNTSESRCDRYATKLNSARIRASFLPVKMPPVARKANSIKTYAVDDVLQSDLRQTASNACSTDAHGACKTSEQQKLPRFPGL